MAQGATRTLERLTDTEDALDEKLDKGSSAVAAKKLATGFDIELTGAVSGIAENVDGSKKVTIATARGGESATLFSPANSREEVVGAGENFTVPEYVVGSNTLKVYWNGLLCIAGANNTYQYKEVGTTGSKSTVIQFWDDVTKDVEIYVRTY